MSNGKAHSEDVLIVATLSERTQYRQFVDGQIVPLDRIARLEGRRIRIAWLSEDAMCASWPLGVAARLNDHEKCGTRTRYIKDWKPEPPSIIDQIRALSEANATTGRDFGRGYSKAIKDVVKLLLGDAVRQAVA